VVVLGLGLVVVGSVVGSPIYLADAEPSLARGAGWSVAAALAVLTILVAGRDVAQRGVLPSLAPR